MQIVTAEDVQARLPELLDGLAPGERLVITRGGKPVATLAAELPKGVPIPGRGIGMLTIVDDDDDHLKDFPE